MNNMNYEHHTYKDPDFPITLHLDTNQPVIHSFFMHWHEHLEILYFTRDEAVVTIDAVRVNAKVGDMVIINSNHVHTLFAGDKGCSYHCLIIDKNFCDTLSIPINNLHFSELINDQIIMNLFNKIVNEISAEEKYYKQIVKAYVLELLVTLCREHCNLEMEITPKTYTKQLSLVKNAISYIGLNYKEKLTVDDICAHIGYTKYYFCRTFKAVTGKTVIEYINILRCNNAWKLLSTNEYNVSESALESGFTNLSYFTKTYKRLLGRFPSDHD